MSNSSEVSGEGVATAIGAIKWVLIAVAILGGGMAALNAVANEASTTRSLVVTLILLGTALWCLFVWVLFGWFEHTLNALIRIARNTSAPIVGSYEVPPAPYEQRV